MGILAIITFACPIILLICFNLLDRRVKKAKEKGEEVKENGCLNFVILIAFIGLILGILIFSLRECSDSARDIREVPARGGRRG